MMQPIEPVIICVLHDEQLNIILKQALIILSGPSFLKYGHPLLGIVGFDLLHLVLNLEKSEREVWVLVSVLICSFVVLFVVVPTPMALIMNMVVSIF